MNNDSLTTLLTDADVASPPPPSHASQLATAVRSRSARRSRSRRAGAFSVLAILLCASLIILTRSPLHQKARVTTGVDIARLRLEIARLDSEAALHQSIARAIERGITARHRLDEAAKPVPLDPIAKLQEQREITAAILVHQATKLSLQPQTQDDARRELTRAATLFSDTTAGQQATVALRSGV